MSRTSRWDRPRSPRDFRWFVRGAGSFLIVTGLLMFGFVAYQLWGTGIEYARAQDRIANELDDVFAAADVPATAVTTVAPTTSSSTSTPTSATTSTPTSVTTTPASTGAVSTTSTTAAPTTTVAPTSTAAPTTTMATFDFGYIERSKGVGYLQIPSIGIDDFDLTFVEGVDREDLHNGPGHYPSTPFPGELGNAAIAGHRTTWGAPFDHLPDIEVGDDITVVTPYGTFVYVMTGFEIVAPDDVDVIGTVDPTKATLTLTTCHPRLTAKQRYIVYAELDPTRSSPVGPYVARPQGGVTELASEDVPAPSSSAATTSTTAATATTTTTTTSVATQGRDVTPASSPSPVETTTTTTTTTAAIVTAPADSLYSVVAGEGGEGASGAGPSTGGPVASEEAQDAFSTKWFADQDAIPQVALWAAACAAVVLAGYQLAKRFRNSFVGLAVGVAPFVGALYFFYQNVNRLLPAGI